MKPTKQGVVKALIDLGFSQSVGAFPPALKSVVPAEKATQQEVEWAKYLIYDNDFGGAWDDAEQINMHLA